MTLRPPVDLIYGSYFTPIRRFFFTLGLAAASRYFVSSKRAGDLRKGSDGWRRTRWTSALPMSERAKNYDMIESLQMICRKR